MSKHTPGPWSWGSDYRGLYGSGEDNDVLSTAYYENMWLAHKRDEAEREANARLIAAAPDLLEALQSAIPFMEDEWGHCSELSCGVQCLKLARAAIRRAYEG